MCMHFPIQQTSTRFIALSQVCNLVRLGSTSYEMLHCSHGYMYIPHPIHYVHYVLLFFVFYCTDNKVTLDQLRAQIESPVVSQSTILFVSK